MTHFKNLTFRILIWAVIPVFIGMQSCSNQQESADRNESENEEITTSDYNSAKNELKKDLRALKEKTNARIDELKVELESASGEAENKIQKAIDDLEAERVKLNNSIDEVEMSTRETWSDVKVKAEKLMNDAETKMDKAVEDVKEFLTQKDE